MKATLFRLGLAFFVAGVLLGLAGCSGLPGWLTTIGQTLPLLLTTVGTVLTGISKALGGNPALEKVAATLGAILTKATSILTDIQSAYNDYQKNPQDSTISQIESGIQAGIDTIQQLFGDLGLPAAIAATIQKVGQIILDQFKAWQNILPTLKAAHSSGILAAHQMLARVPVEQHPLAAKDLAAAVNTTLDQPTGDDNLDAILKSLPRLQAA